MRKFIFIVYLSIAVVAFGSIFSLYLLGIIFIAIMSSLQYIAALTAPYTFTLSIIGTCLLICLGAFIVLAYLDNKRQEAEELAIRIAEYDPYDPKHTSGPYGSEEGTYVW